MSEIILAPHPSLRQPPPAITELTQDLVTQLADLQRTLKKTSKPRGVGLAGPQVNQPLRAFATQLRDDSSQWQRLVYLNPRIIKHSPHQSIGPENDPDLEGCLSIPQLYGPVPRWDWVEVEYETIDTDKLQTTSKKATGFEARLIQHEIDHLNGILFTDHSLSLDLPVYIEQHNQLELLSNRSVLAAL